MYDNYFFLKRITKELQKALEGFDFVRAFSQKKNEIILDFSNRSKNKFLIFSFNLLPPLIDLKEQLQIARKNVAYFFSEFALQKVKSVSIDNYERNIRIHFDRFQIVIMIRAKQSNVFLLENNDIVLSSFKKNSEYKGSSFNELFEKSKVDSTFFTVKSKFNSIIEQHIDGVKNLYHQILGKVLLNEIIFRRNMNPEKSYFEIFHEIQTQFDSDQIFWHENNLISIGKFLSFENNETSFDDFFYGLRKSYYQAFSQTEFFQIKNDLQISVVKKIEKLTKKIGELKSGKNLADNSEIYRNYGNILIQYSRFIKKGQNVFKVKDENDIEIVIKLDMKKSPIENAESYFNKAKEEKSRLDSLKRLITVTEKDIMQLKNSLSKIESANSVKEIEDLKNELHLSTKITKKSPADISEKFRHFIVFGDYDVYVGKDSKSNDLLTTKFAKPDDLWFHARSSSGSHTVLKRKSKKVEIPKAAIYQAASIAGYYSKAKHSKLVPVAYAEKKYVVKRKNIPEGTVIMQREKVLIVEPKLPKQIMTDFEE